MAPDARWRARESGPNAGTQFLARSCGQQGRADYGRVGEESAGEFRGRVQDPEQFPGA